MWVQPEITQKLYIALWAAFLASCFFPYRLVGLAVGEQARAGMAVRGGPGGWPGLVMARPWGWWGLCSFIAVPGTWAAPELPHLGEPRHENCPHQRAAGDGPPVSLHITPGDGHGDVWCGGRFYCLS